MSSPFRIIGGFLAGAAIAAVALAVVARSRGASPLEGNGADGEAISQAEDPKILEGLRFQVKEAEDRVAEEDAAAEKAVGPSGRAGVAAAALARALKGGLGAADAGKAAKLVAHLLSRLRYEYQLADEELLIAPLRDRMVPDFLAAMGFALSEAQQKKFEDLSAFEDQAWKDRLAARGRETPLQRVAASLDLAQREEDWLQGILTPQQQSTLLSQPTGKKSADNVCMVGRRWIPPGRAFDPRQDGAGEALVRLWTDETGVVSDGYRFAKYADSYVQQLRDLGPAPVDSSGSVSLGWRRRQASVQSELQRSMLGDEAFDDADRSKIRKWLTADVWRE